MDAAASSSLLLELSGVTVAYGRIDVLKGLDLVVGAREAVAVVGSAGSGRTTLVLAIGGVLRPRAGRIRFAGRDLRRLRPEAIARLGLSHPESQRIFEEATVEENLRRAVVQRAQLERERGETRRGVVGDLARWLAAFPALAARRHALARTLDAAARRQLAIARGILSGPRLLLLDEPFAEQSPEEAQVTAAALRAARAEGIALLYTDTLPPAAPPLADRVLRLDAGRLLPLAGPSAPAGPAR